MQSIYKGETLKLTDGKDINNYIVDMIQSEISVTEEFNDFKNRVEKIVDEKLKTLNQEPLINDKSPQKLQLTLYKVNVLLQFYFLLIQMV